MNCNSHHTLKKCDTFVKKIIERIAPSNGGKTDTAFRAEMVRADNPQTEYQAYKHLVQLGNVKIENEDERRAFALIGAAIARHRIGKDGNQNFGEAMRIASTLENGDIEPAGERRMKRILACKNASELIDVLRPILRFILQNERVNLNFTFLLKDLLDIISGNEDEKYAKGFQEIKILWTKAFYKKSTNESETEDSKEEN